MWQQEIRVQASRPGLLNITDSIRASLPPLPETGMLHIFIRHTSASLVIQENASSSAKQDLEEGLNRLVPEGQSWHQHLEEGPDDTTAHIKSALTSTFLLIPISQGQLALGTWQGVFLWEHRREAPMRKVLLSLWP